MKIMNLVKRARDAEANTDPIDLARVVALREQLRAVESKVSGAASSLGGYMDLVPAAGKTQRLALRLAQLALNVEADLSPSARDAAIERCAQDERSAFAAAEEESKRLASNAETLAAARRKLGEVEQAIERRREALDAARRQLQEAERKARADVDAAVETGNLEALSAAEIALQKVLAADESQRPGRASDAAVVESLERQRAAHEAEIARIDEEGCRIEGVRGAHVAAAARARWDAGVNEVAAGALLLGLSGVRDGRHLEELRLLFHDPKRVFASGVMEDGMLTTAVLDRLSPLLLQRLLDEASALLNNIQQDLATARQRRDDPAASSAA